MSELKSPTCAQCAKAEGLVPIPEPDVAARAVILKIAQVASGVGFQAGVSATEVAGLIVSILAANPELTSRFLAEGTELFIDGTFRPENGCLTYIANSGALLTTADLRASKGLQQ